MKTLLLCLAGLLIAGPTAFAQKINFSTDSLIDQTDFKHNKQYFLDHYASDDSTKALINTFFRVRKAAAVEVAVGVFLSGGSLLLINYATNLSNNTTRHYKDDYSGLIVLVFLIPTTVGGIVGIGEGAITYLIYSRKKLLRILANYQQGKPLPRRFTHRTRYRQELRKVKGIKPTIWNILFST